jgi:ABC-type oligopeptide transport system substrate-binding subunit
VLLSAAALAGPSRSGGIFKVAEVGPGLTMDPQVTSYTTTWGLEYATAAKLFNFPDSSSRRIVPEVAAGYTISKDGRTYTFPLREGFRFSDGTKVTAKNFADAFRRVESTALRSPGAGYLQNVESYRAKDRSFIVRLKNTDSAFLSTLTMPFFQATSRKLPLDHAVSTGPIPSAGPYALTYNDPQTRTTIRRNPYYTGDRPHFLKGVTLYWNQNPDQAYLNTLKGRLDEYQPEPSQICPPSSIWYQCHTRQFVARPLPCTGYIAFNTRHGVFADVQMRKAFNWVVSRRDYAAQAGLGAFPWTHLLPPNFPGSIMKKRLQPYSDPLVPRLAKARKLAAGHFGDGKITVLWRSSGTIGPAQKQIVNRDLLRLGFQEQNITYEGYPSFELPKWDMALSLGWCQDYPDPYDFFYNVFLRASLDDPISPVGPKWTRQIKSAAKLVGPARLKAFGKLDIRLMKEYAPIAAMRTYNNIFLLSNRVVRRSLLYSVVYSDWDYAAIRFK